MLKYTLLSEKGNRLVNEDAVKIAERGVIKCFTVCDGLGGYEAGDVASQIAAKTFMEQTENAAQLSAFLPEAFAKIQHKLLERQDNANSKRNIKTTAVAMITDGEQAYVGHVGDSRWYGFLAGGGYVRTRDHSMPQLLADAGTIGQEQIRNHPSRNMLLRALGERDTEPAWELIPPVAVRDYRGFLLCSDGFWEWIGEDEMERTLHCSDSPRQWLEQMAAIVEANGAGNTMDNYSAIAIINM